MGNEGIMSDRKEGNGKERKKLTTALRVGNLDHLFVPS